MSLIERDSKGCFLKGGKPWNTGKRMRLICQKCGREFTPQNYHRQQKYCSLQCGGLAKRGVNNPMFRKSPNWGKKCSEKTKRKISERLKGRKPSEEEKKRLRNAFRGKRHSEETRRKLSVFHNLPENRRKKRLIKIKQVKLNYGIAYPNYNKQACEHFRTFDEENRTKGRYAVYGNGEYLIKSLGYWVDYINFEKKLIMEWDEAHHFNEHGNLKERDRIRQKEIQELFPDFTFIRIKEEAGAKR